MNAFDKFDDTELTILLYHGVTDNCNVEVRNANRKHLHIDVFREQMKILQLKCNVLSMDEVLWHLDEQKSFPAKAVAVTFDDGFKNNYSLAAPLLDSLKIPSTFYLSSGLINTNLMFWVDQIEDCITMTNATSLEIVLNEKIKFRTLDLNNKIKTLKKIKDFCKSTSVEEKNRIIGEVIEQTGIKPSSSHSRLYETMSWEQVTEMNRNKLFTFGAHTTYHDIMSRQSEEQLSLDIQTSINLLQMNLSEEVKHFSYPEGQKEHFSDGAIKILKSCGIKCCPTAIPGQNSHLCDPFSLKRIMVGFNDTPFPAGLC